MEVSEIRESVRVKEVSLVSTESASTSVDAEAEFEAVLREVFGPGMKAAAGSNGSDVVS